jgi:hypothetical protein
MLNLLLVQHKPNINTQKRAKTHLTTGILNNLLTIALLYCIER